MTVAKTWNVWPTETFLGALNTTDAAETGCANAIPAPATTKERKRDILVVRVPMGSHKGKIRIVDHAIFIEIRHLFVDLPAPSAR